MKHNANSQFLSSLENAVETVFVVSAGLLPCFKVKTAYGAMQG